MILDEAIKHTEEFADYDCYNEKQLKCAEEYRQLAEWLKELKWLREQTRWIPVTERLPEEAFGCFVTVLWTNPKTMEDFETLLPEFVGYDGETWNNADGKPIAFEVVAWMPLPEPYKAESEDKE